MKYLGIFLLASMPLFGQSDGAKQLSEGETKLPIFDPVATRELIRQWVLTERLVSEEQSDWRVEQKSMQDLLDVYQKELTLLNEELAKVEGSSKAVDEKKERWSKELKEYRQSEKVLAGAMARIQPRMRRVLKRLPQPLLEKVAEQVELIESADVEQEPRDVLKAMLGVLMECGRFNRSYTLVEETRELDGGKKMTVDVLYLGLARAYYTASEGDAVGVGLPTNDGWSWQQKPELAEKIRRAIAVLNQENQPQLVELPISILNDKKGQ